MKSAQKLFPIAQKITVNNNNYKLTYTKMWHECLQEDLVQATSIKDVISSRFFGHYLKAKHAQ